MKLQDALFNWLQIKLVADSRTEDRAARDTMDFFEEILRADHKLTRFEVTGKDERFVTVSYEVEGETKTQRFERETVEQLLHDINANPKYNE